MRERKHNSDGRVARGERTREAIVDAHTALLREGVLVPTGQMLADRAGVSLRTVWLNFKDLEGLLTATTAHWMSVDTELRVPIDTALPLTERIAAYCRQRANRLDTLAPAARSAALGEPFSVALQASRRKHVRRGVADLEQAFGPELAAAGPGREVMLTGLFVATSWTAWALLRDDLGMDVEASTAVMVHTVTALLPVPSQQQ